MRGVIYRLCPVCGNKKQEQEFSKDKSKPDGLQYRCKKCAKNVQYTHQERNPNYRKDYYVDNKELSLTWHQKYIENNPDYYKEYQRARRETDKNFNKQFTFLIFSLCGIKKI